jgi:hypothetical protein
MASIFIILFNSQVDSLYPARKTIFVALIRTLAIVVRKIPAIPTNPVKLRRFFVVLRDTYIHMVWIDDCKIRMPRGKSWDTTRSNEWTNYRKARIESKFVTFTLKPGFILC